MVPAPGAVLLHTQLHLQLLLHLSLQECLRRRQESPARSDSTSNRGDRWSLLSSSAALVWISYSSKFCQHYRWGRHFRTGGGGVLAGCASLTGGPGEAHHCLPLPLRHRSASVGGEATSPPARARAVRSHPSSQLEAEPQWTAVNSRLNRLIFSHHTLVVLMGKIGHNITRLALKSGWTWAPCHG